MSNTNTTPLAKGGSGPDGLKIIGGVVMVRNPKNPNDFRLVSTANLKVS